MGLTVHSSARQPTCELLPIRAAVDVGHARRTTLRVAEAIGLDAEHADRAGLVATELASNLLRHADAGALLVAPSSASLHIASVDRGPGLDDVGDVFSDGYSSDRGMGGGLGAVRRLSDEVRLHTSPARGTVLVARFGAPRPSRWVGLVTRHPREAVSGDAWWLAVHEGGWRAAVVDGLGHGPLAREATERALETLEEDPLAPLQVVLRQLGAALVQTRGVVISLADLDISQARLRWTGVGNVAGVCIDGARGSASLGGINGILGRRTHPTPRVVDREVTDDHRIVLHTDGLRARWSPEAYGALWSRAPELVASRLLWDQHRGSDDAAVLVLGAEGGLDGG